MNVFRGLTIIGSVALVLGLAGCSFSSAGAADTRQTGTPIGIDIPQFAEGPLVVAYDDGSVDVVTWGSASCPAEATSAKKSDGEFVAVFESRSEGNCTADMAATTHTFSADAVGSSVPQTARVVFPEWDDDRAVEIIRADARQGVTP